MRSTLTSKKNSHFQIKKPRTVFHGIDGAIEDTTRTVNRLVGLVKAVGTLPEAMGENKMKWFWVKKTSKGVSADTLKQRGSSFSPNGNVEVLGSLEELLGTLSSERKSCNWEVAAYYLLQKSDDFPPLIDAMSLIIFSNLVPYNDISAAKRILMSVLIQFAAKSESLENFCIGLKASTERWIEQYISNGRKYTEIDLVFNDNIVNKTVKFHQEKTLLYRWLIDTVGETKFNVLFDKLKTLSKYDLTTNEHLFNLQLTFGSMSENMETKFTSLDTKITDIEKGVNVLNLGLQELEKNLELSVNVLNLGLQELEKKLDRHTENTDRGFQDLNTKLQVLTNKMDKQNNTILAAIQELAARVPNLD